MSEKVIFYGPVRGKSNRVGGGETGNERTITLLRERLGYEVRVASKTYGKGSRLKTIFQYLVGTFFNIFLTSLLLVQAWKKKILHISGFYGSSVYVELVFVLIGMLSAKRVVYEVRAGGAEDYYVNGGRWYRWAFQMVLKLPDVVLSQGRSQIDFLKEISPDSKIIYYPNFVLDIEVGQPASPVRIDGDVRIVYFGRLAPEKGLNVILEAVEKVSFPVSLELIGAISSDYKKAIEGIMESRGLCSKVKISPPMPRLELGRYLEKFHFFIFPTRELREGHSNALNEAMAKGVVPIVSDWGFNRDVVCDDDLVVGNIVADEFSRRINDIWQRDGGWLEKSHYVKCRVRTLFSENSARQTLLSAYQG